MVPENDTRFLRRSYIRPFKKFDWKKSNTRAITSSVGYPKTKTLSNYFNEGLHQTTRKIQKKTVYNRHTNSIQSGICVNNCTITDMQSNNKNLNWQKSISRSFVSLCRPAHAWNICYWTFYNKQSIKCFCLLKISSKLVVGLSVRCKYVNLFVCCCLCPGTV